jgi:hypothetical protein
METIKIKIKLNETNKKDFLILGNGVKLDKIKYVDCEIDTYQLERLQVYDDVLIKSINENIIDNVSVNTFKEITENEDNKNVVEDSTIETNNSTLSQF